MPEQIKQQATQRRSVKLDVTYRRTASGDEALHSVDTAVPVDYGPESTCSAHKGNEFHRVFFRPPPSGFQPQVE